MSSLETWVWSWEEEKAECPTGKQKHLHLCWKQELVCAVAGLKLTKPVLYLLNQAFWIRHGCVQPFCCSAKTLVPWQQEGAGPRLREQTCQREQGESHIAQRSHWKPHRQASQQVRRLRLHLIFPFLLSCLFLRLIKQKQSKVGERVPFLFKWILRRFLPNENEINRHFYNDILNSVLPIFKHM